MKALGIRKAGVIDAFFDSLTVLESTPGGGTRSKQRTGETVKITPGILLAAMDLCVSTIHRTAYQQGQTVEKGPRSTSEKAAQEAYTRLKKSAKGGFPGKVPMVLPALRFQVRNMNEATVRLPPDSFLQTVVEVIHETDRDKFQ